MSKPFFSIVIPTLNEEKYLPNLLGDLVKQKYKDFEVIVVDGKSKDKTIEKANIFQKRISSLKIVASEITDLSTQRNLGAQKAHGEWLIFSDADNRLSKLFLTRLRGNILKDTKLDFFGCQFTPDTNLVGDKVISLFMNWGKVVLFKLGLPMPTALIGITSKAFNKVSGFRPHIYAEDRDLGLRAKRMGLRGKYLTRIHYVHSFRRFRYAGIFTLVLRVIKLSLKNILRIPYKLEREYPMGGDFGKEVILKKSSTNSIW